MKLPFIFKFETKGGIVNNCQKMLIPLIMLLFLLGCAAPSISITDQTGRNMPTPNYVLHSTDKKVSALFYYTAYYVEKDLDGYEVPIPQYLDLMKNNDIPKSKYKHLTINIEIQNPTEAEYSIWELVHWTNKKGLDKGSGNRIGYSNRKYRSYTVQLPNSEDYRKVRYGLTITNDNGQTVMNLGEFRYSTY